MSLARLPWLRPDAALELDTNRPRRPPAPAGRDGAARREVRDQGWRPRVTREELLELARGVDAIVADPTVAVDEAVLEAAGPQLRVVANFAVGYDNVDLDACRRRGVAVTNTPDVLTNATAELALALTLAAARRMTEAEADLRGGRWRGWDPGAYLGLELTRGDVRGGRAGTDRAPLRRAGRGLRRRGPVREPHRQGGCRAGAGRPAGAAGGDLPPRRRGQPPPAGERRDDRAGRGARAIGDEARGDPRQHLARAAGRLEGAGPGPARRRDRRRGPRRLRARARRAHRAARGAPLRAVAPHRLRHHAGARRHGSPGRRERPRRRSTARSHPTGWS